MANELYVNGTNHINGQVHIPPEVLDGVREIHEAESQAPAEEVPKDEDEWEPEPKSKKGKGKAKGKGKCKAKKKKGKESVLGLFSSTEQIQPMSERTPVSHSRTSPKETEQIEQDDQAPTWEGNRAADMDMYVDEMLAAFGRGDADLPSDQAESPFTSDAFGPNDTELLPQEWVAESSMTDVWYSQPDTFVDPDGTWSWPSLPDPPSSNVEDACQFELDHNHEEETVAAESLLNLHSTPIRPTDIERNLTSGPPVRRMLEAPQIDITPRPQITRTRSFIQPFARARPEAPTRSLSFSVSALDDPFVLHEGFTPDRPQPMPTSPTIRLAIKHQTFPSPSPILPLRARPDNHNIFNTPLRRTPIHMPSSVWRESVVCSPNAETAAKLGLAPAAVIITPGLFTPGPSADSGSRRKRRRTRTGDENSQDEGR